MARPNTKTWCALAATAQYFGAIEPLLELPPSARMNCPGTATGNWHWQLDTAALTPELGAWLRNLGAATGRIPAQVRTPRTPEKGL